MMMTGGLPIQATTARKILGRIRKKSETGKLVGRALAIVSDPIELSARLKTIEFAKSWDKVNAQDWSDVYGYMDESARRRKGLAHQVVGNAESGARWAGDIHDVLRRRNESARAGKFKITENSPNTARITVGPDQRERRKKYIWERVGVQRQIAAVGVAAAVFGGAKLHGALSSAGKGDAIVGARNIFGKALNRTKNAVSKAVGGGEIEGFTPIKGPLQHAEEMAADAAVQTQKRKETAAKVAEKLTQKFGGKGESTYAPAHYSTKVPGLQVPAGHPEAGDPVLHPSGKQKKMRIRKPPQVKTGDTPVVLPNPHNAG
jgi:hypothetical protein